MFYAVHKGLKIGIYYNWSDCKIQINGFKGAIYKKFSNLEDAQYFLEHGNIENTTDNQVNDNIDFQSYIDVYTDGSLIRKNGYIGCGYGIYIPKFNIRISTELYENKTNNRAELKAIIDTINLLKLKNESNIRIHTDSQYCILIYGKTGIKFKEKQFKNVINKDLVIEALESKNNVNLLFNHVKAHTGTNDDVHYLGNDIADNLANIAAVNNYVSINKKWNQEIFNIGQYNCMLNMIPIDYLKNYINKSGYINLCKKNEHYRTIRNIIIYYIEKHV